MSYPDISLSFLNSLEPIPDDAPRYPVTLLERNIHGKLRKMQGESMQIQIPAKGARYLMDIAYAMRAERERNCDYAANVITLPASFFGIHVPLHVKATVTVKQSGLAVITISSVGGTWSRSFWPDMCEINDICFEEPSSLIPNPVEIGNLRLSVYSLRNMSMRHDGVFSMPMPVLDADNYELISSGVIRWNGVDPARDGRLGSEGYMTGNNRSCCMDVFCDQRGGGIALIYELADMPATGSFSSICREAADLLPSHREFFFRAMADIEISFKNLEPRSRRHHEDRHITSSEAERNLKDLGFDIEYQGTSLIASWEGIPLLGPDAQMPWEYEEKLRRKALTTRFIENLALPLHQKPFVYRRNILFNVPLGILKRFTPKAREWERKKDFGSVQHVNCAF